MTVEFIVLKKIYTEKVYMKKPLCDQMYDLWQGEWCLCLLFVHCVTSVRGLGRQRVTYMFTYIFVLTTVLLHKIST